MQYPLQDTQIDLTCHVGHILEVAIYHVPGPAIMYLTHLICQQHT